MAGLLAVKSVLYGTTAYGGVKDEGTVFQLTLVVRRRASKSK
jgi:uncharacterized repeat protein (TIGR03803 family)